MIFTHNEHDGQVVYCKAQDVSEVLLERSGDRETVIISVDSESFLIEAIKTKDGTAKLSVKQMRSY